jgi:hypothetical protein
MAVFQGARLRTTALPDRGTTIGARGVARPIVGAVPRPRPAGVLLAVILGATMLGLVYLTQTLASNAASSEISDLRVTRADIWQKVQTQSATITQLADDSVVASKAAKLGLHRLGHPLVLTAP